MGTTHGKKENILCNVSPQKGENHHHNSRYVNGRSHSHLRFIFFIIIIRSSTGGVSVRTFIRPSDGVVSFRRHTAFTLERCSSCSSDAASSIVTTSFGTCSCSVCGGATTARMSVRSTVGWHPTRRGKSRCICNAASSIVTTIGGTCSSSG